jgi:hypothetical protein
MLNTNLIMLNKSIIMKKVLLSVMTLVASLSFGQNVVNVSAGDSWNGYMNWFDLVGNYQNGSGWGVPELRTDIDVVGDVITLYPNFNTYANALGGSPSDIDYWTNSPDGGLTPGPTGNKIMEANTLVEPAGFNDQDLTFKGSVLVNTLDASYSAKFFIKALDPANGYADALGGAKIVDLPSSGNFSVSATAAELPAGLIIQYGFVVTGLNANPADENVLGRIVIGPSCDLDLSTSTVGATITANASGVSYQWIDCDANTDISGETQQSYTPSVDGNYAVIIDNGNCSDTSDCVAISFAGIEEIDNNVVVYPNPVEDVLNIDAFKAESIVIYNVNGSIVLSQTFESTIDLTNLDAGVYFIHVSDQAGVWSTKRFIKR